MKTLKWMAIPLSQNLYALVDSELYEELSKHKWYAYKSRYTYYAGRSTPRQKGKQKMILMHRVILGLSESVEADHRNGCGLDNRRTNLRPATNQQNHFNQFPRKNVSSRFKGVVWHKRDKKWQTRIRFSGKVKHLGYFNNEVEAAKAYDKAAKELFGEFAHTNF